MGANHRSDHSSIDSVALARELRNELRGEVRFDDGSRALYATDASHFRRVPVGVVLPRDDHDVVAAMAICRRFGAPVLSRGAGTSLAGQCCNVAVVIDYSKYMNRILEIDAERRIARVQPGVILERLRAAAEEHHLTFAPDPAPQSHNTVGGMIGNHSCGIHSLMGGRTVENILELDLLTYEGLRLRVGETKRDALERILAAGGRRGEIYGRLKDLRDTYAETIRARCPDLSHPGPGFNLRELLPENDFNLARALVGSEGTCVAVLEATVRLVTSPPSRVLLLLGYPDLCDAGDQIPVISALRPTGMVGIDSGLGNDMISRVYPGDFTPLSEGWGWLLVEFGGDTIEEATEKARQAMDSLKGNSTRSRMHLCEARAREALLEAVSSLPGTSPGGGWVDSTVPTDRLGEYLRRLRRLMSAYGYRCELYGHFGQGCIHSRSRVDEITAEGGEKDRRFLHDAADLATGFGGTLFGGHEIGQERSELLERIYGPRLVHAFEAFKRIWDPQGKMNPGNMVDPRREDPSLRHSWKTMFQFPDDQGEFSRALSRCVGVGKCRREESGTMCPSYMVLREEKHTTRGRAHILFEMLQGDLLKEGWREEAVRESLDLCLSCKGCRGECPENVDMATYRAEFLHHYHKAKRRPRHACFFGHVDRWLRLGSWLPGVANGIAKNRALARVMKGIIGMPQERRIPILAPETFQHRFRKHRFVGHARPPVILWPDTFNNHYSPDTAMAAVAALEAAGFRVQVPQARLCCGRPLYQYGFLDRARRLLLETLHALEQPIREGVPVVVLEPACASVFRNELVDLFPRDEQARRLKAQTYLFAEFLAERAPAFTPAPVHRKALVHLHCHQKATMQSAADGSLLEALGIDFEMLDSGCCGMAGAFGFEKEKYDLSIAVGNRVLLPAVRNAEASTLIVADGFSCREQIRQCTGRQAIHIADVVSMALRGSRWEGIEPRAGDCKG